MHNYGRRLNQIIAVIAVLFVLLLWDGGKGCQKWLLPLFTYASGQEQTMTDALVNHLQDIMPLSTYGVTGKWDSLLFANEGGEGMEMLLQAEGNEGIGDSGESLLETVKEDGVVSASGESAEEAMVTEALTLEELLMQENARSAPFVAPTVKAMQYDWETIADYESLLSAFYAIDSQALAGSDLLNLESLKGYDLTVEKTDAPPQILIYHTHSTESFADSVSGDRSQTIVGVGEHLTKILTEEYGYSVLHHTAEYDTVRDDAYANSLPAIEQLLAENPSIQVVIDLHRDAGSPSREMVVDINGKPTARFMFFNGISRSKQTGDIDYLYNPNLAENLAFSFQMQVAADEYYPGLTRKIYIKQYRYNMHLRGKTLLVELGDENNTVEEAMNACYPLAHLLDLVLSGKAQ